MYPAVLFLDFEVISSFLDFEVISSFLLLTRDVCPDAWLGFGLFPDTSQE